MMRTALITGVTGFIGGRLAVRLLAEGWQVHAIVRPSSETAGLPFAKDVHFHVVDKEIDLIPIMRVSKPDVVFHLASLYLAEHRHDQVTDLIESNVLFPSLLAEAMAQAGVRCLVNTGTAWQRFCGHSYLPVNLYAATKQAAEDLLSYYVDARGLSLITLRLFDTYGEGDKRRKIVQILIDAAKSRGNLAMSPGEQIIDLLHVDDVVDGFLVAGERILTKTEIASEVYHLSGERYSLRQIASIVENTLNLSVGANFGGRDYRAREVMVPVDAKDNSLPNWKRRHSLKDYIINIAKIERSL